MTDKAMFAAKLKALREKAEMSQYALAIRTGLSKQAISRLEAGEREPAWDTVQRISLALGVDTEAFRTVTELPFVQAPRPKGRPRTKRAEEPAAKRPSLRRKEK